ncbi:MAG: hypothetical protein KIT68_11675 [Phycisphaeraceae bacterium]|nr:hypothetical protein [Phycisphaeraceae bacterium]
MHHRTLIPLLSALLLPALAFAAEPRPAPAARAPEKQVVVRLTISTAEQLAQVERAATGPWDCRPGLGTGDWQAPAGAVESFRRLGLGPTVIVSDVDELLRAEGSRLREAAPFDGAPAFFDDFRDLAAIDAKLNEFVAARPDLCARLNAGTSIEGRQIWVLRIARPSAPAGQPAVLLNGTQHAREWLSPMSVMYIADELVSKADSDPTLAAALDRFTFYIVPTVNPDGYAYTWTPGTASNPLPNRLWRKNKWRNASNALRGVDLNRNWGFQWGGAGASTNQSNETYRGTGPFSEPETQAMRDFITARPEILAHIDFHTYGRLILSPWGYTSLFPVENPRFGDVNAAMKSAIIGATGGVYTAGPSNVTIYPASGVAPDWMYGARGTAGWTIELAPGDGSQIPGSNPPQNYTGFVASPAQILPAGRESLAAALAMLDTLDGPARFSFMPDPLPNLLAPNAPTPVRWTVNDLRADAQPAGTRLFARVGLIGPFLEITPTADGDGWAAALPGAACGAVVQFYLSVPLAGGGQAFHPPQGPARPYQARTGTGSTPCAPCRADVSRDGFATGEDFDLFIEAFFTARRDALGVLIADLATAGSGATTPDTFLTGEDFDLFVQSFFTGCP